MWPLTLSTDRKGKQLQKNRAKMYEIPSYYRMHRAGPINHLGGRQTRGNQSQPSDQTSTQVPLLRAHSYNKIVFL